MSPRRLLGEPNGVTAGQFSADGRPSLFDTNPLFSHSSQIIILKIKIRESNKNIKYHL